MVGEVDKLTAFKLDRDRFVAYAFAAAHLFLEIDHTGKISHATGAANGLAGNNVESLIGHSFFDYVTDRDRQYFGEILKRLNQHGRIEPRLIHLKSRSGKELELLMGGFLMPSDVNHLFLSFTVPPKASIQANANDDGHRNPIPDEDGLLDRRQFNKAAVDRLTAAERLDMDSQLTLLVVDGLDKLAKSGDPEKLNRVLSRLSAYLRAVSYDGTTASKVDVEKFGVLHANGIDQKEIRERVTEIIQEEVGDDSLQIRSFSLDFDTDELNETDATKALIYSLRKFHDTDPDEFSISSLQSGAKVLLEDALARINSVRDVIEKRNFDVVYQPIVELYDERIHHLEALTRITGISSPQAFIEFTEEVGMIEDFDLALTQRVLEDLKAHSMGGWRPSVAINLSAKSLTSSLFCKSFDEVLRPFGKLRKQLMLELTETVNVSDFTSLNETLQHYRESGVKVCIDDVGSGSTSFQSLTDLKVDFLKIDGRFVGAARENDRDMALLKSIIDTGKQLGVKLIAEHIEDNEQARLVEGLGVELGQGYLFGRPTLDHTTYAPSYKRNDRPRSTRKGYKTTWG